MVPQYGCARTWYESDRIGRILPFGSNCWTMALSVKLSGLMQKNDVDPGLGLLARGRANEIDFSVADEPGWFLFNFDDSISYDLWACADP